MGVIQPTYTVKGANGERVTKKSKSWYAVFTRDGKTVKEMAGTREKALVLELKRKQEILDEKNGLPTQRAGDLTCTRLMEDYLRELASRATKKHKAGVERKLDDILTGIRAFRARDITPERVGVFLDQIAERGAAPRTVNTYLQAAKGFLNWAVSRRKLPFNPIGCLKKRPEHDKRRKRRPLTDDECGRLLWAASEGPFRRAERKLPGGVPLHVLAEATELSRRNGLVYLTLLDTGLRLNELKSLEWQDTDFERGLIHCREAWTKNRRNADLPLTPAVIKALQEWHKGKGAPTSGPVVHIPSTILKTFNDDLKLAGIEKRDAGGRTVDLHSLRHSFAQRLNASGADPKTMQALMRHSTPVMTLGTYVHSDRTRMKQAVDSLPGLEPVNPGDTSTEQIVKTGTDGAVYARNCQEIQRKKDNSLDFTDLKGYDSQPTKPKVGGSNPPGCASETECDSAQSPANKGSSSHSTSQSQSVDNYNKEQEREAESNLFVQGTAKKFTDANSELQTVIDSWENLPEETRARILSLVKGVI